MKSITKCVVSGLVLGQAVHLQAQPAQKAAPVAQQLPEQDIKALTASLSEGCGKQFSAMLLGKGPELHTFGETDSSGESCKKLDGHLCATEAHVKKVVEFPNGRTGKSSNSMVGNSCLPKDCVAEGDLSHLASFMKGRAKESLPDKDVDIILSLDCSKSGGAKYPAAAVAVEQKEEAKKAEATDKKEKKAEDKQEAKAEDAAGLASLRGFGEGKTVKK
eukprot:TRINITY_DN113832_c0_g1_i1.p1 TRINITY_DN113832_c0_g1~~TRINITY_DN113832_c0_g1_i1.p1  ORF type:complete len:218 (-),score=85.60 TRINITY_DN113832_c0_g1_i1:76-729(-)